MEKPPLESNDKNKLQVSDDMVVEYTIHSMLHSATVEMDPTKLELLEEFKKVDSGHQYSPKKSNVKVIISSKDWSEKKFLIYGSESTDEARQYIEQVVEKVQDIGHEIKIRDEPRVTNLAINGDFGRRLNLEDIYTDLFSQKSQMEYEPEQFPGIKFPLRDPTCTFLLFSTGTFVIQGLTSRVDIEPAIEAINELIFN